ncbi:glycogenin glucosyltransferase [Rhizoclosmatium sp. JEL0117]|nr:glycogenin glucosyltransferase [Rhizoclosmatium sp. JEL0117]
MSKAVATLVTSDGYVRGACAMAHSIRKTESSAQVIALVPPSLLSRGALATLYRVFDRIVYVPLFTNKNNKENLQLLGRPELDITYTKLHVFSPQFMEGFEKVAFIDADAFATRNVDSLFEYLQDGIMFAAAPDVGWPDIFNSGVFVARPNQQVYDALMWHAEYGTGSFDGGDQGLLNRFFSSWAGFPSTAQPEIPSDSSAPAPPYCPPELKRAARLPFTFNVTPSAVYTYLPAVKEFKSNMSVIHFAGHVKPWDQYRFSDGTVWNRSMSDDTAELHNAWWRVYDDLVKQWVKEDEEQKRIADISKPKATTSKSQESGKFKNEHSSRNDGGSSSNEANAEYYPYYEDKSRGFVGGDGSAPPLPHRFGHSSSSNNDYHQTSSIHSNLQNTSSHEQQRYSHPQHHHYQHQNQGDYNNQHHHRSNENNDQNRGQKHVHENSNQTYFKQPRSEDSFNHQGGQWKAENHSSGDKYTMNDSNNHQHQHHQVDNRNGGHAENWMEGYQAQENRNASNTDHQDSSHHDHQHNEQQNLGNNRFDHYYERVWNQHLVHNEPKSNNQNHGYQQHNNYQPEYYHWEQPRNENVSTFDDLLPVQSNYHQHQQHMPPIPYYTESNPIQVTHSYDNWYKQSSEPEKRSGSHQSYDSWYHSPPKEHHSHQSQQYEHHEQHHHDHQHQPHHHQNHHHSSYNAHQQHHANYEYHNNQQHSGHRSAQGHNHSHQHQNDSHEHQHQHHHQNHQPEQWNHNNQQHSHGSEQQYQQHHSSQNLNYNHIHHQHHHHDSQPYHQQHQQHHQHEQHQTQHHFENHHNPEHHQHHIPNQSTGSFNQDQTTSHSQQHHHNHHHHGNQEFGNVPKFVAASAVAAELTADFPADVIPKQHQSYGSESEERSSDYESITDDQNSSDFFEKDETVPYLFDDEDETSAGIPQEFKTSRYEWNWSEATPPSLSKRTSRARMDSVSSLTGAGLVGDAQVFYVVVPKDADVFDELMGATVNSRELARVDKNGIPLALKARLGKLGEIEVAASNVMMTVMNTSTLCNILSVTVYSDSAKSSRASTPAAIGSRRRMSDATIRSITSVTPTAGPSTPVLASSLIVAEKTPKKRRRSKKKKSVGSISQSTGKQSIQSTVETSSAITAVNQDTVQSKSGLARLSYANVVSSKDLVSSPSQELPEKILSSPSRSKAEKDIVQVMSSAETPISTMSVVSNNIESTTKKPSVSKSKKGSEKLEVADKDGAKVTKADQSVILMPEAIPQTQNVADAVSIVKDASEPILKEEESPKTPTVASLAKSYASMVALSASKAKSGSTSPQESTGSLSELTESLKQARLSKAEEVAKIVQIHVSHPDLVPGAVKKDVSEDSSVGSLIHKFEDAIAAEGDEHTIPAPKLVSPPPGREIKSSGEKKSFASVVMEKPATVPSGTRFVVPRGESSKLMESPSNFPLAKYLGGAVVPEFPRFQPFELERAKNVSVPVSPKVATGNGSVASKKKSLDEIVIGGDKKRRSLTPNMGATANRNFGAVFNQKSVESGDADLSSSSTRVEFSPLRGVGTAGIQFAPPTVERNSRNASSVDETDCDTGSMGKIEVVNAQQLEISSAKRAALGSSKSSRI